ncbi:hydrolase [Bifidobacterium sp. DSM 109958]|uniref:Hydrolase n=1 Tax=Bifidobacterium moraviense TaxID=2675323 RepID=A0A7Y0F0N6_9BIFI|nr:ComEC/Rec2 family competence protein [Bifidobacterium sp. DSM 109958]NMM99833.1 hydrolase [Bifidobacterium sp. DSM 109958]
MRQLRGLRARYGERERGSRDWRLLPVAACVWGVTLACPSDPLSVLGGSSAGRPVAIAACAVACLCALAAAGARRLPHAAALATAVLAAALSVQMHATVAAHDIAAWSLGQGTSSVVAVVRIRTPAVTSDRRDADCRTEARLETLLSRGVMASSRAETRVYAEGTACALHQGAAYLVRGTLETPRFGTARSWLTLDVGSPPVEIAAAAPPRRVVHAMQAAFIHVTQRLDDQGQVLVPGLTLGILGSGVADPSMRDDAVEPVDGTYAAQVEEWFRTAGIMHLMAVSGGHFAVIGTLIRRLCALLRLPRPVAAACTASGYAALAAAMMPTDSVMRAMVMGSVGACAFLVGRRGQGMSMLCVTVTAALIVDPALARSLGFALSCAAVLGILWWARPLGESLGAHLPAAVAEPLATTLAAQALTLPLQILLEPELPLLSPVANLLTAPVVTASTLAGLGSLVVCAWAPWLGHPLAWLAGCGTAVMERIAAWCADAPVTALPWFEGPAAAVGLLAAELGAVLLCRLTARALRGIRERCRGAAEPATGDPTFGTPYRPTLLLRTRTWLDEGRRLLSSTEA